MKFLMGVSIIVQGRLTLNFALSFFGVFFSINRPGPPLQTQKNAIDCSMIWMKAKVLTEDMNLQETNTHIP